MESVLIANRGEIAVRVIRACRDLGIRSIAVYAEGEQDDLHARLADEAWSLGGATAADSYLDVQRVLSIARRAGAAAIHPGYGFLSENAAAARAVRDAGLIWVGPSPEAIEELGDKVRARRLALAADVPLVPGTGGPVSSVAEVEAFVDTHGLPIAIKAAHGGGGRGMRIVRERRDIAGAYESAGREAAAAFGNGECFVERYLDSPRHVEAQLLADAHGGVRVVGTRDCSLQRRHQKVVEEAPAPFLHPDAQAAIVGASERIAVAADYVGAGTVEFLLGASGELSFLEVNTRLQVEHPITEETSGIDLVEAQLRIAAGERLDDVLAGSTSRGHALEFRITAEDPALGFLPRPGVVTAFHAPSGPGVRVDSGVEEGSVVSGRFDSLLAKLVVSGRDRDQAVRRARRALAEFRIEGVPTTLAFHRGLLDEADFVERFSVHTRWIETELLPRLHAPVQNGDDDEPLADQVRLALEIDGRRREVGLGRAALDALAARLLARLGNVPSAHAPTERQTLERVTDPAAVVADVAGLITKIPVAVGDAVAPGDVVVVLEAMKMESPQQAEASGVVAEVLVRTGQFVERGDALVRLTS